MNLPKIILASGSPRRSEILGFVGWEFEKHVADIDETELNGENPAQYVQRLAKEKAEVVAQEYGDTIVLGADTTVVIDNKIIGKPIDLDDARRMLKMLSGREHEVLTGVALVKKISDLKFQISDEQEIRKNEKTVSQGQMTNNKEQITNYKNLKSEICNLKSAVGLQTTRVRFSEMNDEEIEYLVQFGEPFDKAGAYAVQAQAALFIEKIKGDYWNVVGLPINLVYRLMREFV